MSSDADPVAVNTPSSSTDAVPARCISSACPIVSSGNGNPVYVFVAAPVKDVQLSFVAPVALLSCSWPPVTPTVNGARSRLSVIPDASTASHDLPGCVIEMRVRLPENPTPPPDAEVDIVKAI